MNPKVWSSLPPYPFWDDTCSTGSQQNALWQIVQHLQPSLVSLKNLVLLFLHWKVRDLINCVCRKLLLKKKGDFSLLYCWSKTQQHNVWVWPPQRCPAVSWSCSSAHAQKQIQFLCEFSISKPYLSSLWPDFLLCFVLSPLKKQLLAFVLKTT